MVLWLMCIFFRSKKEALTNYQARVCVWNFGAHCEYCYVKYEAALGLAVWGLCERQGFGVDHELCQRLVAVDYRARCPSVLNKRMNRIKRQCSAVFCKLDFTPHIRERQGAQEPQANMMDKSIDPSASAGHLHHHWDSATAGDYDDIVVVTDLNLHSEELSPFTATIQQLLCHGVAIQKHRTLSFEFVLLDDIYLRVQFYSALSFLIAQVCLWVMVFLSRSVMGNRKEVF